MSKPDRKQIFNLRNFIYFFAVIIAFALIWSSTGVVLENYELQKEVDNLSNEVVILELENQRLSYNNEYFKTDAYLEFAARESFNKKSPGENVVYVEKFDLPEQLANNGEESLELEFSSKSKQRQNIDEWFFFLFGRDPS